MNELRTKSEELNSKFNYEMRRRKVIRGAKLLGVATVLLAGMNTLHNFTNNAAEDEVERIDFGCGPAVEVPDDAMKGVYLAARESADALMLDRASGSRLVVDFDTVMDSASSPGIVTDEGKFIPDTGILPDTGDELIVCGGINPDGSTELSTYVIDHENNQK